MNLQKNILFLPCSWTSSFAHLYMENSFWQVWDLIKKWHLENPSFVFTIGFNIIISPSLLSFTKPRCLDWFKTIISVVFKVLYSPFKFIHFCPVHLTFFPISSIIFDRLLFMFDLFVIPPPWSILHFITSWHTFRPSSSKNLVLLKTKCFLFSLLQDVFIQEQTSYLSNFLLINILTLLQKCQILHLPLIDLEFDKLVFFGNF